MVQSPMFLKIIPAIEDNCNLYFVYSPSGQPFKTLFPTIEICLGTEMAMVIVGPKKVSLYKEVQYLSLNLQIYA
jgi:hypothetical protein